MDRRPRAARRLRRRAAPPARTRPGRRGARRRDRAAAVRQRPRPPARAHRVARARARRPRGRRAGAARSAPLRSRVGVPAHPAGGGAAAAGADRRGRTRAEGRARGRSALRAGARARGADRARRRQGRRGARAPARGDRGGAAGARRGGGARTLGCGSRRRRPCRDLAGRTPALPGRGCVDRGGASHGRPAGRCRRSGRLRPRLGAAAGHRRGTGHPRRLPRVAAPVGGGARAAVAPPRAAAGFAGGALGPGEEDRRELGGALFRLAVPLLGAHRAADAEAALDAALRLFPGHPELSFYRALALEERGRHREAAQLLEQIERTLGGPGRPRDAALAAIADGPTFLAPDPAQLLLDARVQAALSRGRAGETAKAARRMKALFSADPRDEGVALGLLEAFERAGRVPAALALLEDAARKHPDTPALLYARASALARARRVPEALAAMRKVLALAPAHAGALNYVGYVMTEQGGDLREAEGLLRRAVELRPDDGAVADSLGFCLLKEGRVEAALEELRRADRLAPGDPVILGHLGDALLAAGRRDDAAEAFRRALARLVRAPRGGREGRSREGAPGEQEARSPEPGDARVRAELEEKLRSLTAP